MVKIMQTIKNDSAVIPFPATAADETLQGSYAPVRYNAMKHGILSMLAVLPHEDAGEFSDLLAAPFEFGLSGKGTDLRDLMDMTPEDIAEQQRDTQHDLEATRKASAILRRGGANAYDKALRALLPDSCEWWEQYVEEEEYQATAEGLGDFISEHLEPLCMDMEKTARHHEAIKSQALGEGLQAYRLEKLNRYETHLDRKFERTLAMILKMKQLRIGR
jgi:hypothetical protein